MADNPLQNITILLYGTKHSGNIGSAARAMSNMGIGNLALVSPQCVIPRLRGMGVHHVSSSAISIAAAR